MGRSNIDAVDRGDRLGGPPDSSARAEGECGPIPWVVLEHLRGHTEDGYIEAILKQRVELGHAIHGVFDDRHVRAGLRKCVGDVTTGGEFEDVGDPYPVSVRSLLHSFGEFEQLPCVAGKPSPRTVRAT